MDRKRWPAARIRAICALLAAASLLHSRVVANTHPAYQDHHHHQAGAAAASDTDLHLTLTSLDDRLIAYQYTDPGMSPATASVKPTATHASSHPHEEQLSRSSDHELAQNHNHPNPVQSELDPTPICHEGDPCHLGETRSSVLGDQPTTEWTDLHITPLASPSSPDTGMQVKENNGPISFPQRGDGHPGFYSPREEREPVSTAATTMTFSTEVKSDPSARKTRPTSKRRPDEETHHHHDTSTTPEPTTVKMKAPTSPKEAYNAHDGYEVRTQRRGQSEDSPKASHATTTGPPMPTPEPLIGNTGTMVSDDHHQDAETGLDPSEPATIVHWETQALADKESGSKAKKRVQRKTTLIIENMTIIHHPPKATTPPLHGRRAAKADPVLLDGGIEGQIVASIVGEERSKKSKTSSKMMTRGHVNDEL